MSYCSPMMVDAAERYSELAKKEQGELTEKEQEELVASASEFKPLFPRNE